MSRAKHAHTLIKRMQPAPVPDGASQPGSKAKLYQTGAKGVDQVSSTMRRRCFFRRGAPISKCALLTFPEERREMADHCAVEFGYTRVSKILGKESGWHLQSSQDLQSSEPNMQPYDARTSQPRHGSFSKRPAIPPRPTPTPKQKHIFRQETPCKREALLSATPVRVLLVASRRLGWCSATGAAVLNVKQAAVQLAILSGPLRGEGGALNAMDSVVEGKGPVGAQSLASPSMGSRSQSLLSVLWCKRIQRKALW